MKMYTCIQTAYKSIQVHKKNISVYIYTILYRLYPVSLSVKKKYNFILIYTGRTLQLKSKILPTEHPNVTHLFLNTKITTRKFTNQ